jgi:RNA polymerase sigma-70 factor (ECF subfamily)
MDDDQEPGPEPGLRRVTPRRRRGSQAPDMTEPTGQAELVARAREGDQAAFEALVRATYADTYTLAKRLTGNEEDARDVVQESYLRAYRGLKRFRGDAQFTTWLYRITANCANTHMGKRSRRRTEPLPDDLAGHAALVDRDPDRDPAARADASLLRERLEGALDDLPPKLRSVVVLRDIYDMPHEEIAANLGISESAAKVRLHRARRKLREQVFPGRSADSDLLDDEEDRHAV